MRERSGPGGRKSKGPRYARTIRFPEPLYEALEEAAKQAGYGVNDYVVAICAHAKGAGIWPAGTGQERLPISA